MLALVSNRGRFSHRAGALRMPFDTPRGARFGGGGGGESVDMVSYTNLLPTYIPNGMPVPARRPRMRPSWSSASAFIG